MKRNAPSLLVLAILLLSALSCSRKQQAPSIDEAISKSGIVALQGAGLYASTEKGGEASLEWRANLDFGASLRLLEGKETASFTVGNAEYEFVPLSPDSPALAGIAGKGQGTRFWIRRDYYAGQGSEAAVVVADLEPDGLGRTLRRGELVAASRGQGGEAATGFVVDPISKRPEGRVELPLASLSFEKEDLRSAIALAKAASDRDEAEAKAILEEAERSAGNSGFLAEIAARLAGGQAAETLASPGAAADAAVEALVARFTVKDDGAAVRKEANGKAELLATLKMDDEVESIERTPEAEESGAGKARWYHISAPVEGWIFGADLVGAD